MEERELSDVSDSVSCTACPQYYTPIMDGSFFSKSRLTVEMITNDSS